MFEILSVLTLSCYRTESGEVLPRVFSIEPGQPLMQSDQALYCCLTKIQVLFLISLKVIMDSTKMEGRLFYIRNSAVQGLKILLAIY